MTTAIKAIETRYAGCLFRSRLEARWAVFFDKMGIRWEYEPQGVVCTYRLTRRNDDGEFPYLPDFWLPDLQMWAEVKGTLSEEECLRLLDAAASLSCGNCSGRDGRGDMVVLGPVPRANGDHTQRYPVALHMHKGSLQARVWTADRPSPLCRDPYLRPLRSFLHSPGWDYLHIGGDWGSCDSLAKLGGFDVSGDEVIALLLDGVDYPSYEPSLFYTGALTAARSARFEHGRSGS